MSQLRNNHFFSDGEYEILNNYKSEDGPFKLILCVNYLLGMSKGKIAAQCCHATLGAYKLAVEHCHTAIDGWEEQSSESCCQSGHQRRDI